MVRSIGFSPNEVWRLMFVGTSVWVFAYHLDENGRKHLDETGKDAARVVAYRRLAA